jgi:hypothetical protein
LQRADVARSLIERLARAWRHGEHPAQLVDGRESLARVDGMLLDELAEAGLEGTGRRM